MSAATTPAPPLYFLRPGSVVIERYEFERDNGGKGVQWVVHGIASDGDLVNYIACDTRREAAEFVARGMHS